MQRNCAVCSASFEAQRPQAKFCSAKCRVRASRNQPAPPSTSIVADSAPTGGVDLVTAVTTELEAGGRENSALGVQAIQLAHRMAKYDTGSGFAALSKELRAVMAAALQNAAVAADPVDELRARRDNKRRSAS